MKKLLTLTLSLVALALPGTKVMNQTQIGILNTSNNQWSQHALATNFQNKACTPPPLGMVAWWPLDEQTGTTAKDIAGGHNGVFKPAPVGGGGPVSVAGSYVGNSLQFPFNARVEVPDSPDLNFGTGDFTVDAWVKYTGPSPGYGTIVEKRDMSQNGYVLRIATPYPKNQPQLQFSIGNTFYQGPDITAPAGTWFFVAAARKGATVTLSVNNDSISRTNPTTWQASSKYPLWIGFSSGAGSAVKLAIDEVEVFDRALTQSELQSIVNAGSAGKCSSSAPQKKGMTWYHTASNPQYGTITVGCGQPPNGCEAYKGDTLCTQPLPVLCIYKPKPGFQPPVGLPIPNDYVKWSGGVVATTPPVAGNTFPNVTDANSHCEAVFGKGWRVAEFHDGWGWYFQAYGGTVSAPIVPSTRFWVHINTTDGNCWKR